MAAGIGSGKGAFCIVLSNSEREEARRVTTEAYRTYLHFPPPFCHFVREILFELGTRGTLDLKSEKFDKLDDETKKVVAGRLDEIVAIINGRSERRATIARNSIKRAEYYIRTDQIPLDIELEGVTSQTLPCLRDEIISWGAFFHSHPSADDVEKFHLLVRQFSIFKRYLSEKGDFHKLLDLPHRCLTAEMTNPGFLKLLIDTGLTLDIIATLDIETVRYLVENLAGISVLIDELGIKASLCSSLGNLLPLFHQVKLCGGDPRELMGLSPLLISQIIRIKPLFLRLIEKGVDLRLIMSLLKHNISLLPFLERLIIDIPAEQLNTLSPQLCILAIVHRAKFIFLTRTKNFNIDFLSELSPGQFTKLLCSASILPTLFARCRFNWTEILSWPREIRRYFLANLSVICEAEMNNHCPLRSIFALKEDQKFFLLRNLEKIVTLMKLGVSFGCFRILEFSKKKLLLTHSKQLQIWASRGYKVSVKKLIQLDDDVFEMMMGNQSKFPLLARIPFKFLSRAKPEELEMLLFKGHSTRDYMETARRLGVG